MYSPPPKQLVGRMRHILAALIATMLGTTVVGAQSAIFKSGDDEQVIERFRVFIDTQDLYNSQGERLSQPWQIIRQDRANYHSFGVRQRGDEGDSFFASAENRATLEQMLRRGHISAEAAREIIAGNVMVEVEIIGEGKVGTAVRVTTE